MEAERYERARERANLQLAREAKEALRKIEEGLPRNPSSMDYFYSLFRGYYGNGISSGRKKKVIGTTCTQVPLELIYASGAIPLRLCSGSYAFDQVGAEFMPAKSCSIVRSTTGMLHVAHDMFKKELKMAVIPTTCDQKRKAMEMWEEMGLNVLALEVPPTKKSEEARYFWQNSVKRLASTLQDMTGHRITKGKIKKAIGKVGTASYQYRRLQTLQTGPRPAIYGVNLFLVTNAFLFDDIDQWTGAVARLNNELEQKKRAGEFVGEKDAPRILFTGSPPIFPGLKVPFLLEQAGAVVVADEACSSSRMLHDSVVYGEDRLYDMIPAILPP